MELEKKQMNFYSILSQVQEGNSASDFKSAYDIQDRISYLLNHRTLLYKDLVSELISYMDTIIQKLEKYKEDNKEKRFKFNKHNKRISELKRYNYQVDESIKIIDEHQKIAEDQLQKQSQNAKEFL